MEPTPTRHAGTYRAGGITGIAAMPVVFVMVLEVIGERGIQPRVRLEIDGLMTIASFVSRSLGISLLPDWSPMWGPNLSLTRIALPGAPPIRRIGMLRAVRGPREKLVDAVLQHAMEVCGTGGGRVKGR